MKPKITLLLALIHSYLFSFIVPLAVIRDQSLYDSLSLFVTSHSLSFVITLCYLLFIRCNSPSLTEPLAVTRCLLLSFDVPLVCLFINDLQNYFNYFFNASTSKLRLFPDVSTKCKKCTIFGSLRVII